MADLPQKLVFRATPSMICSWLAGYKDQVVQGYFKLPMAETPAMLEGRKWHKIWEEWVKWRSTWPPQFNPDQSMPKLINPKTELKLEHRLLDWCDLVGMIDLYCENEGGLIVDYKTGKTEASAHLNTPQVGIYALLATAKDIPVRKVGIAHYDYDRKRADTAYRWVTPALIEEAFETVETVASEIHSYFSANGFYEAYGENRARHYAQREKL